MTKINACEIINQVDNKCFTVYVEWLNSHFKVILIESTMPPLSGEMNTKDIDYYSSELGKSCDEYLQDMKDIFCGKDKEIQFYIQNETLTFKKKEIWTLGIITLHPALDTTEISITFQRLLKLYQSVQDKASFLEKENKRLEDANTSLLLKINKMIESKAVLEQDLYKKFILILNSKKEKIRELEAIKEKQSITKSVFDADTDVSEESDGNDKKLNNNSTKNKKRKSLDNNNSKTTRKVKKKDSITNKNNIDNNKASVNEDCVINKADSINHSITSENKNILEEQSCSFTTRASRSSLNLVEEESEAELFS